MTFKVKITIEHVRRGRRGSDRESPVCLAIKAAGCTHVVHMRGVGVRYTRGRRRHLDVDLPPAALDWLARYETGEDVEGIEFHLPSRPAKPKAVRRRLPCQ